MLRIGVIAASAIVLVVALVLSPSNPSLIGLALGAAVVLVFSLFEARRYRASRSGSTGGWTDTDERFVDPTTGKRMRVRYNPATGERDYVEEPPEA